LSALLALLVFGPGVLGQDEPTTASDTTGGDGKKLPFALYVEAASGSGSADRGGFHLSTSTQTASTLVSENRVILDEWFHARAALGWKLPHDKGDFRLIFNAYREDNYEFYALGKSSTALNPNNDEPVDVEVLDPLVWWSVEITNGQMYTERTPPYWDGVVDDANANSAVDLGEERYPLGADLQISKAATDDLQNHIQFTDLLYGRTFGTRRYSARWWGGLRYFQYEGNLPAGAWLGGSEAGEGYTDGSYIHLLNFSQESRGIGPTGILEADFNFWEERFVIYLQGQIAFVLLNLEMDSGPFWALVVEPGTSIPIPAEAHLQESRNKTTWQNAAEVGVRFTLKSGMRFEAAYSRTGLLDVILMPTDLQIPGNLQTAWQGVDALYNTKDHILDGWRVGIAYQF
jgi:hypothetical protein